MTQRQQHQLIRRHQFVPGIVSLQALAIIHLHRLSCIFVCSQQLSDVQRIIISNSSPSRYTSTAPLLPGSMVRDGWRWQWDRD